MPDRAIIVNGYAYPDIDPSVLTEITSDLTFISSFSYGINGAGGLILLEDGELRRMAGEGGVQTLMVLSSLGESGTFDSGVIGELFQDQEAQDRLIAEILQTLRERGMYGVDFDFEFIPAEDKDIYAELILRTREALNAEGFLVTAALAPKTSAGQQGTLYEGHDYAAVGNAANLVLLMTYEWGYTSPYRLYM